MQGQKPCILYFFPLLPEEGIKGWWELKIVLSLRGVKP